MMQHLSGGHLLPEFMPRLVFQACISFLSGVVPANPIKGRFMNFSRGQYFQPKFDVDCACFQNTPIQNKGEIHELFVSAPVLVWFAGATPFLLRLFQETWHSKKGNPSVYWHADLSCPWMASKMQSCISFRSCSGC